LTTWTTGVVNKALGLLAADLNAKLCLECIEGAQAWAVTATNLVTVFAARPSADERSANHIDAHDGELGDPAVLDKIIRGIAEAEAELLYPLWSQAGQARALPVQDHKLKGAFGLLELAESCRTAGVAAEATLGVLDAAFMRIRRAAKERRSERGKPVPQVKDIVAEELISRVTNTRNKLTVLEQTRKAFQEHMGELRKEVLRGAERRDSGRYGREESRDHSSRDRSRSQSRERPPSSDHTPSRPSLVSPSARRFGGPGAGDRPPSRNSPRDSMSSNRVRYDEAQAAREAGRQRERDEGEGRGRSIERERGVQREGSSRDRERDEGRSRSRERRSESRDRGGEDGNGQRPMVDNKGAMAMAFREECRALGAPPTCAFVACLKECTNPGCRDCQTAPVYDPKAHLPAVLAVKKRCTPEFASTVRFRDR
jgi:hypothetical protein